jgi:hypothetical protein
MAALTAGHLAASTVVVKARLLVASWAEGWAEKKAVRMAEKMAVQWAFCWVAQ